MHTTSFDLSLKNISKIEGHTHLDISVRNGEAVSAKLKINESKRFYTDSVIGVGYKAVPSKVSRICGTCSPVHLTCACEGIERAMGIRISEQSKVLRELMAMANNLRDHAMHLYFFCLPDIIGKDSVLDFDKAEEWMIHDALHVKEAGNLLCKVIGGRSVHPPFANVGGFSTVPKPEEVKEAIRSLAAAREYALSFIDFFHRKDLHLVHNTNFVALSGKKYSIIDGPIRTTSGMEINEEQYREHLEKVILPYSTSAAFEFDFKDFMVGALARVNLNKAELHRDTRKDCAKYLKLFPSDDMFHNNLAQAIENVHCIDRSIEELQTHEFKAEKPAEATPSRENVGVGVIEAPRGTLYHMYGVDRKGIVNRSEIIIPTSQNIIHLEKTMVHYVNHLLEEGISKEKISHYAERLIRAYDPCMSCATHFLQLNWKESA